MITAPVRHRLEDREDTLSPYAARSRDSHRDRPEEPSPLRTQFQRDRDRIVHSKSFRRLKHKTQVFIAPLGDHYVTRLTHTLEVSQIGRTIARALNLNEDLTEAIALGHDIGHTPFGHVGEDELDSLHPAGYRHAEQSLRTVERLERGGEGLNLTWDVRHGIVSHSKPRGDFFGDTVPDGLSFEGQICRVSDAVAYLNHDLADAFRAGVLDPDELPSEANRTLGVRHSERIDAMVTDVVESSWQAAGEDGLDAADGPTITMSSRVREAVNVLRDFMFERVYTPEDKGAQGQAAREIIRLMYRYYGDNPSDIPQEYGYDDRAVVDFIAGMTDLYALRVADRLSPGITKPFQQSMV